MLETENSQKTRQYVPNLRMRVNLQQAPNIAAAMVAALFILDITLHIRGFLDDV